MSGAIPSLPQYAFMAWCLVKHRDNFTFTLPYLCYSWILNNLGHFLSRWWWKSWISGFLLCVVLWLDDSVQNCAASILKMEAAWHAETSVRNQHNTRCHNPEPHYSWHLYCWKGVVKWTKLRICLFPSKHTPTFVTRCLEKIETYLLPFPQYRTSFI
jgi:hypothetical protein